MDCPVTDMQTAGLPVPSKVRFKLFTLDHRLVRGKLGHLGAANRSDVCRALGRLFGCDR
jgi:mRNA interferase MazF